MADPKNRAIRVIRDLVDWFAEHPEQVPETYKVDDADDRMQRGVDPQKDDGDPPGDRAHRTLSRAGHRNPEGREADEQPDGDDPRHRGP